MMCFTVWQCVVAWESRHVNKFQCLHGMLALSGKGTWACYRPCTCTVILLPLSCDRRTPLSDSRSVLSYMAALHVRLHPDRFRSTACGQLANRNTVTLDGQCRHQPAGPTATDQPL